MSTEIERKFLVMGAYKHLSSNSILIKQGYISSTPERSVRIRIKGEKAYLTIKGMTNHSGLSRYEWEKEIGIKEAEDLFLLCEPGVIEKRRYEIPVGKHLFEVDEFFGLNEGLTLAEVELNEETEAFIHPDWLGEEVTGDVRFYNSFLAKNPFKGWI